MELSFHHQWQHDRHLLVSGEDQTVFPKLPPLNYRQDICVATTPWPKGRMMLLACGHFLSLAQHPRQAWNALWLIHEVIHQGRQPPVLEEGAYSVDEQSAGGHRDFQQGYPTAS